MQALRGKPIARLVVDVGVIRRVLRAHGFIRLVSETSDKRLRLPLVMQAL
jgi:hypothetical protein